MERSSLPNASTCAAKFLIRIIACLVCAIALSVQNAMPQKTHLNAYSKVFVNMETAPVGFTGKTVNLYKKQQLQNTNYFQCLTGDCENGTGVLFRNGGFMTEIGTFKNHKLQGQGARVSFMHQNEYDSRIVEKMSNNFWDAVRSGKVSLDNVLSYPSVETVVANFDNGNVTNGPVSGSTIDAKRLPLLFFDIVDFSFLYDIAQEKQFTYTGEWNGGLLTPTGSFTYQSSFENKIQKYVCDASQLLLLAQGKEGTFKVINPAGELGLLSGKLGKAGTKTGWFVTNMTHFVVDSLSKKTPSVQIGIKFITSYNGFHRVLFLNDRPMAITELNSYPADYTEPVVIDYQGGKYIGMINANGQPNGFGKLIHPPKYTSEYSESEGYFANGKLQGYACHLFLERPYSPSKNDKKYITYEDIKKRAEEQRIDVADPGNTMRILLGQFNADTLSRGIMYQRYVVAKFTKYSEANGSNLDGYKYNEQGSEGTFVKNKLSEGIKWEEQGADLGYPVKSIGTFNEEGKLDGFGTYITPSQKLDGFFINGVLTMGSITYSANTVKPGWVLEVNGKKVCVIDHAQNLTDGTQLLTSNFKVLSFRGEGFRCTCKRCNGTGKMVVMRGGGGGTTTHTYTKLQTEQVTYLNAERQTMVKVTETTSTGPSIEYPVRMQCNECWGNGFKYCANGDR